MIGGGLLGVLVLVGLIWWISAALRGPGLLEACEGECRRGYKCVERSADRVCLAEAGLSCGGPGECVGSCVEGTCSDDPAPEILRSAWLRLSESTDRCNQPFDPFPRGGLRSFGCHVRSVLDYPHLLDLADQPLFEDGSLQSGGLVLSDEEGFGRYRVETIAWAEAHIPAPDEQTQVIYDEFVAPLARTYYLVWKKLNAQGNGACTDAVRASWEARVAAGRKGYDPQWFYFLTPKFCDRALGKPTASWGSQPDGVHASVVTTTVGWWLRRESEGTAEAFRSALFTLLRTYDPTWLEAHQ